MGQSIACGARIDGKGERGTALLETDEVIFRGNSRGKGARARVPFASIRSLAARDGWLAIVHAGGSLELELGARAETWEARIRKPKGFVEKLGVKAGARVALVGLEDEALAAGLEALGAKVRAGAPKGEVDVILVRVKSERELERAGTLVAKMAPDGALWIVRPRGKEGVAESAVFAAGKRAGLVDVKVARVNDDETAMKFVRRKADR